MAEPRVPDRGLRYCTGHGELHPAEDFPPINQPGRATDVQAHCRAWRNERLPGPLRAGNNELRGLRTKVGWYVERVYPEIFAEAAQWATEAIEHRQAG